MTVAKVELNDILSNCRVWRKDLWRKWLFDKDYFSETDVRK